jgi:hypothetical protein
MEGLKGAAGDDHVMEGSAVGRKSSNRSLPPKKSL